MPVIARLIGGAGTGKTTELLRLMEGVIEAGEIEPTEIGFVSFTRAARAEAAGRAAEQFGVSIKQLEQDGWFKTLHSVCYRCLGITSGELVTDDKESRKWLAEALDDEQIATEMDFDTAAVAFSGQSMTSQILNLWSTARSRLVPFVEVWRVAKDCNETLLDLTDCLDLIGKYERAKRWSHRYDFTDLLLRFAGRRCHPTGIENVEPEGWVPAVPVWFFDEQQDTSALLDLVCRRLIETPVCKWAYFVGDNFQAIYGWAGADARYFLSLPAAKTRIMPKSYRCPAEVFSLGEQVLSRCEDYYDRKIAPAEHEGGVEVSWNFAGELERINPTESWLVISRTNFGAARMGKVLDRLGVPWRPTRGNGGWNAPARNAALTALWTLYNQGPIDGHQWAYLLKALPSKANGVELFVRGTKARFEQPGEAEKYLFVLPHELPVLGATPAFVEALQKSNGTSPSKSLFLPSLIDRGPESFAAMERWGVDVLDEPGVRVGTVHSVKGQEADNVLLLTTTNHTIKRSSDLYPAMADEERRCAYVGITRARRRLIVAREQGATNAMEIDVA